MVRCELELPAERGDTNVKNIQEVIAAPEYDFLRERDVVKNRMLFLTFGGSHAYGTATPTSDVDLRGCAFNRKVDLIGMSGFGKSFDVFTDQETDTAIYSFNSLVRLLCVCNPNTIEMLGGRPDSYLFFHPLAKEMLAMKRAFLSKRAVPSFGGYATQQLRRLQNALLCGSVSQQEKEEHIRNAIHVAMRSFGERYTAFPEGALRLTIGKSERADRETEIFLDVDLKHYPLRDYRNILSEMSNIVRDYDKVNARNRKKDELHLNKHAMHLIRLYFMVFDILEKEEINTYRENEIPLLLDIRNGKYQNEDGTFQKEFFEMVTGYEKRMAYAAENTGLPAQPDGKRIEEFVMSVNKEVIAGDD
jgi:predicted nucleotidyltransferase